MKDFLCSVVTLPVVVVALLAWSVFVVIALVVWTSWEERE